MGLRRDNQKYAGEAIRCHLQHPEARSPDQDRQEQRSPRFMSSELVTLINQIIQIKSSSPTLHIKWTLSKGCNGIDFRV